MRKVRDGAEWVIHPHYRLVPRRELAMLARNVLACRDTMGVDQCPEWWIVGRKQIGKTVLFVLCNPRMSSIERLVERSLDDVFLIALSKLPFAGSMINRLIDHRNETKFGAQLQQKRFVGRAANVPDWVLQDDTLDCFRVVPDGNLLPVLPFHFFPSHGIPRISMNSHTTPRV